jgi:histidinol dehydrogenase
MVPKRIAGTTYLKKPEQATPIEASELRDRVAGIIRDVARDGDEALKRFSKQFDRAELESVEVTPQEIEAARRACDAQLLEDMRFGIERVTQFAEAQHKTLGELEIEAIPGLHLGHRLIPIRRAAARYTGGLWVGSYIKTVTHQWVEQQAIDIIAPICVRQSRREALDAHRVAAEIRIHYDVV